jgi:hypothetical protein
LGIYILRGYIFKPSDDDKWKDFDSAKPAPLFVGAASQSSKSGEYGQYQDQDRSQRFGGWGGA